MPFVPPPSKKAPAPRAERIRVALDTFARRVPMRVQRVCFAILATMYFVLAGARLLEVTLLGLDPRLPYVVTLLVGLVFAAVFGPTLYEDAFSRESERKRREREWEQAEVRDPEADARLRRDIGMTPNTSLERSRDG